MAKRKTRRRKKRTKRTSKSIHLGNGFRLNLSKSGINLSGGVKGARLSLGNKGLKSTLSIPGTGISKTKTLLSTKDLVNKVTNDQDDKVKRDQNKNIKKTSKTLDRDLSEDKNKVTRDQNKSKKLNEKELEVLRKREESAKRVKAVEAQFKTGNHKDLKVDKVIDKELAKSFFKEGFKSAWWIALILIGALILIFNLIIGLGIILIGGVLLLLEYVLPKNKGKRYFNTGIDLYTNKEYDEAIKEMEKAILFIPDHEYINVVMGRIKLEVFEDIKGAMIHLTKAMDLYQNKDAIYLLGKCYFAQEDYVKTIELLQKIRFKKSKEENRILLLSRCYLLTNESQLAIESLLPLAEKYVINKDELIEVNYWLGYAYLDDFNVEKAREYLELVYHQDPEYKGIQRLIDRCDI